MKGWEEVDCFNNIPGFEVVLPLSTSFRNGKSVVFWIKPLHSWWLWKHNGALDLFNHWEEVEITQDSIVAVRPVKSVCVAQVCCSSYDHCSWVGGQSHVCPGRRAVTFPLSGNIPQESLGVLWNDENQLLLQQAGILGEVTEIWGVVFISVAWLS